jgi:diketogulonate reductase-like aldo/keto reductase
LRQFWRRALAHVSGISIPLDGRAAYPFEQHSIVGSRMASARGASDAAVSGMSAPERAAPVARVQRRAIPRSSESIPVIGLGTWQAFDAGPDSARRTDLAEVVRLLAASSGSVLDSSPMYGRSEQVAGEIIAGLGLRREIFLASKVWCHGRRKGERQMESSLMKLRTAPIDLMQVHNLEDLHTHSRTLRAWKEAGRVRYIGLSHYHASSYPMLERLARTGIWDFVQINFSMEEREAENRLLPACADAGVAVIANRPFFVGGLFARIKGRPLPGWAADIGCRSWSQFFLKYVLGHPAVTCVIPATRTPAHMSDNLQAGTGEMPGPGMRKRMADYLGGL